MANFRTYISSQHAAKRQHAVSRAIVTVRNWRQLTVMDESSPKPKVVARISTLQFGLIIFIIAGILTLYIGHVHQSRELLGQISVQQRENVRLHLQRNRLVADFNASIGPSVIHQRGSVLGLQSGYEFAGIIRTPETLTP